MKKRRNRCAGIMVLPRTLTFRVPSLTSSKQWDLLQCEVKIVTLWPSSCRPTAASTTSRSAPPIPRSGWMNQMSRRFAAVAIAGAIAGEEAISFGMMLVFVVKCLLELGIIMID